MNRNKIKDYILQNFNKVKINSMDILCGDVFIALPGKNNHGASFIKDVLENGASFVVTDKILEKKNVNKKIIIVENVLDFLDLIAKEKRKIFNGKIIGITGSVGKTSVKENLIFFLENSFNVSASIKNYNNYLGVIISLLNLDLNSDYAIFEIGTNDFYEIRKLTSIIKPSQVIITNIYPTHLEKLINTKNIAEEKSDIFNPNYNKNTQIAILPNENEDEKIIIEKAFKLKLFKIITFGNNSSSDMKNVKIKPFDSFHSKINLKYQNRKLSFVIPNNQVLRINNILICLCIFIFNKINLDIFFSVSMNVPLVEGRGLENNIIFNKKNIKFIDESYNASPKSMKTTIDFFSNLKTNKNQKKFLVLGDMKELGKYSNFYHKDLLNYIYNKKLENIIICGEYMKIALDKNFSKNFILMFDKNIILEYLERHLSNNDIILIKGSNSSITNEIAKDLLKRKVN